jgi:methylmalonyl-CoA mutase cobalamin-binding domain/chain
MSTDTTEATKLIEDAVRAQVEQELRDWEGNELAAFISRAPESKQEDEYLTGSRLPVKRVYTPADVADAPWEDIGLPGRYPFTRGPYPTMYRGRPWTMRQIAGFGTPDQTNERFQYLIAQGQTGLSVDFDMPTLMGYDSDDPKSIGEVGREGVAVDVMEDMDQLFDGVDLEAISVSMTINPSAWILLAMYIALAEDRGLDLNKLSGTIQNDILKEYIAQKEWIYPPGPSMRIVRDTITYTTARMARYNPINISGYHIQEAGSSSVQEAAFTMAITRAYVREVVATGLHVDEFAPRLSFFFVCQSDFFEEIAKFRALRRCYARMMKEEFGATKPESMRMRFHCQTAAATLTKPQPLNNIVRTALQALAAVLGGTQSLHTNGLDEAYTIPSEMAMKIALRTQQIIAEETQVTQVIDPLGGSYFVETLTNEFEEKMNEYLDRIEELGGTLRAIELNYFQREIADFAYDYAQRKASGDRAVVGVNKFIDETEDHKVEVHAGDPTTEARKINRLKEIKRDRDNARVDEALKALLEVAKDPDANLMPATIDAVRAHASMGEIVYCLEDLFGRYSETPVF